MKRFLTCLCLSSLIYNSTFAFSFDFGSSIQKGLGGVKTSFSKSFSGFTSSLDSIKGTFSEIQTLQGDVKKQFDSVKGQVDALKGAGNQVLEQVTGKLDGYKQQLGAFSALGDEITAEIREEFQNTIAKAQNQLKLSQEAITQSQQKTAALKQKGVQLKQERRTIKAQIEKAQQAENEYLKKDAALAQALVAAQQDSDEQWALVRSSAIQNGYGDLVPETSIPNTGPTISPIAGIWKNVQTSTVNTDSPDIHVEWIGDNGLGEGLSEYDLQKLRSAETLGTFDKEIETAKEAEKTARQNIKTTNASISEKEKAIAKKHAALIPELTKKQNEITKQNTDIDAMKKEIDRLKKVKEACKGDTCKTDTTKAINAQTVSLKNTEKRKTTLETEFKDITDKDSELTTLHSDLAKLQTKKTDQETTFKKTQEKVQIKQQAKNNEAVNQAKELKKKATTPAEQLEAQDNLLAATSNAIKTETDPVRKADLIETETTESKTYKEINKNALNSNVSEKEREITALETKIKEETNLEKKTALIKEKEQLTNEKTNLEKARNAQALEIKIDELGETLTTDQITLKKALDAHKNLEKEKQDLKKKKEYIGNAIKACTEEELAGCKAGYQKALNEINKKITANDAAIKASTKATEDARRKLNTTKASIKEAQEKLATYQCEYQDASKKTGQAGGKKGPTIYSSAGYCVQLQVAIGDTVSVRGKNGIDLFTRYVGIIYKYAASIIGIIAVLIIIISGIQITFAGFNSELASQGKTRIFQALASLILLFLIGMILKTVNPTFFDKSSGEELTNLSGGSPTTLSNIDPSTIDPILLQGNDGVGKLIVGSEAQRDKNGNIRLYKLAKNDGGGTHEYAGINSKYHPKALGEIEALVKAGKHQEAENYAANYIQSYSGKHQPKKNVQFQNDPGIDYFLKDTTFNRGGGGANWVVKRANSKGTADTPQQYAQQLRAAREEYETEKVGHRANFSKGLTKRWNDAEKIAIGLSNGAK